MFYEKQERKINYSRIIFGFLEKQIVLQNFFDILLIFIIFVTVWDAINVFKDKKSFGKSKWSVKVPNYSGVSGALAVWISIIAALIPLISFANHTNTLDLTTFAIVFVGGIILLIHSTIPNGINEKGIMHWGMLHKWDEIQSYSFTDNFLVVTLKFTTNKIRLIVNRDEKEKIKLSLKEQTGK